MAYIVDHLPTGTESSDYPVSAGAYQEQLKGNTEGFLTKLSPMGAEIVYSSYIGGRMDDVPLGGGVVDAKGNYIFTGMTWSLDFPVTEDALQGAIGGESDAFIVVFNPGGNGADDLVYSSFLGGPGYDDAINMVVDRFGNIYLIGEANESGFPVTADAFQSEPGGNADAFLAVLNLSLPSNEQLLYATRIGGANSDASDDDDPDAAGLDFASGLGQDGLGNVYIHGLTVSNDFPVSDGVTIGDFAAIQTEINGPVDAFVAKFHIWDEAEIDIRPGDAQNIVYAGKSGVVPMAVLSSLSLDAPAEIDPTSVRLAGAAVMLNGAGEPLCRSKDVNRDGLDDLVCHIQANQLDLHTGETVATLIARTHDGDILIGQDGIRLMPETMTVGGLRALLLQ